MLLGLAAVAMSAPPVRARVIQVTERGFVLRVGGSELVVEDTPKAHFWLKKVASKRTAFVAGADVYVRIKTDSTPVILREMADPESSQWLDDLRSKPHKGTVKNLDAKTITFGFADGSEMIYRVTAKTKVTMKGADVSPADLKPGDVLYIKCRALSTLDLSLVLASDLPIKEDDEPGDKRGKGRKKSADAFHLAASGTFEGEVGALSPAWKMFDVLTSGTTLHVSYNPQSRFLFGGVKGAVTGLKTGMHAKITYRRDTFGRIVGSRIEVIEKGN